MTKEAELKEVLKAARAFIAGGKVNMVEFNEIIQKIDESLK